VQVCRSLRAVTRPDLTKDDLLRIAETDLYYEVAMLRGGLAGHEQAWELKPLQYGQDHPIRIAWAVNFEAALLHARVLNDFLTGDPRSRRYRDDVFAGDFIPNWQPPTPGPLCRIGPEVKRNIDKQLAHLSSKRVTREDLNAHRIVTEVLSDMRTFAFDPRNVCYDALRGVRDILDRDRWQAVRLAAGR